VLAGQQVTITQIQAGVVITASRPAIGRYGDSDPFDVGGPEPDITISKITVPPALSTYPGDDLRYLIRVNNGGIGDAVGVTMEDAVPDNTTYVPGSAAASSGTASYVALANTVVWSGDVPSGGSVNILFEATVDSPLESGTRITNTAYVSESHLAERGEATRVTTVASRLQIEKTADPAPGEDVNPGDSIDYTILLTNVSGSDLTSVVVTDTLDPDTSLVAGQLSWTGVVTAGESVAIPVTAIVNEGVVVPQAITNTVEVDDGQGNSFTDEVSHNVVSELNATKVSDDAGDDGLVYPGDLVTYTLFLRSSGGTVSYVSVNDPMPAHTTFVPGSETGGAVYQEGAIRWTGSVGTGRGTPSPMRCPITS
jgi:uncharacterized repeat protein (TIGR01451 family)